ncbi:MAG: hypothetical protein Crog4KO_15050 [Crocinitomicaceae bacterium]
MKGYKIQIPNPCSQDWKDMTPRTGGRHCESCNTVVVDFSKMSDTRIYHHLTQSNGKACGRIRKDQLNRVMRLESHRNSPNLLSVVLGMTLLLSTYPVQANELQMSFAPITLIDQLDKNEELKDGHEPIRLRFRIIDEETLEPIPFVKLYVLGENDEVYTGVVTDFDGYGTIELSPDHLESAKTLHLNGIEYGETRLTWSEVWETEGTHDIKLTSIYSREDLIMVGGISLDTVYDKKTTRKQKRYLRRENRREKKSNN